MAVYLHHGDLPDSVRFTHSVAIDTETMGLNPARDRLCLVQISAGDESCHLVKFDGDYAAPNLRGLLADPAIEKIFHFARFDVAVIQRYLGVLVAPIYCTKTASRLARTYTDRHSLKELCRELLSIDISKAQQSSDWGNAVLTEAQTSYAAQDVLYLHRLRTILDAMLEREGRQALARRCFDFIDARARLDLEGWAEQDIFAH